MENYQKICNKIILPVGDTLFGLTVSKRFKEIQKFQWMDRSYIEKYQLQRLQNSIVSVSNNVPFYRDYFKQHKIDAKDFENLHDIRKLPIMTKEIIRENFKKLQLMNHKGKTYEMKSSGSTGQQTTVLVDNKINSDIISTQLLFWSWGDFFMGTPHLQTGMSLERGLMKSLKDLLFKCTYVSAFKLHDKDLKRIVNSIIKKKLNYIFGYASSVYLLAKYLEANNIKISLTKIFTWGDCLYPHYRRLIEKTFSTKVIDCYGLGEGLQVACQCGKGENLHIAEHNLMVEIISLNDNKNAKKGEMGRVVVTRYEPGPMPLLRYDTGDVAAFCEETCSCGRKLKMISRIYGRDTDIVQSPSGDRLIVHFFTQIFEMIPEIKQFQIRQNELSKLIVNYVPSEGCTTKVLEEIKRQINSMCEYKFDIEFVMVDCIPLENSNKRRFVISNILSN